MKTRVRRHPLRTPKGRVVPRREHERKVPQFQGTPVTFKASIGKGQRRKPRGGIGAVRRHYRMAFLKGEESANLLRYRTSSQELVMMPPEEYLRLLGTGLFNEQMAKEIATDPAYVKLRRRIERGEPVDAPFLDVDVQSGLVRTQEGRHRALIAMQLGIPEIPVILYHVDERGKTVPIRRDPYHPHDTWETKGYTRLRARGEGP